MVITLCIHKKKANLGVPFSTYKEPSSLDQAPISAMYYVEII